ncbi:MAG: hypothetical protein IJ394_07015 [Bacteroidales bacterium]|nr:hypothetical protein [Bacteroidales bacterium]
MKRIVRKIVYLAATALSLAAVSCQKDDTLRYGNVTMGNVVDGSFVSDQGNVFNVVEQQCSGKIDTMKRALVVCDVLRETEGVDGGYDVRLVSMMSVLDKNPVKLSEIEDDDALTKDPVHIKEIWYSGGYLNIYIMVPMEYGSRKPHLINLILDDNAVSGDSYTFELRHNGFGEVWSEENSDYILAGAYVSFPIGTLISGNSADITLNWKWHKAVGSGYSLEVIDKKLEFKWERGTFEQAPLSLASKAVPDIM